MAEIARFEKSEPVFTPVAVRDSSESAKAMSEVFGSVAKTASEEATSMAKEQRTAMLLHAQNQVMDAATQARIKIAEHPDMASTIAQGTKDLMPTIAQGVDTRDREQLQSTINSHIGGLEVSAAEKEYSLHQRMAAISFYDAVPDRLQDIASTFNPDEANKKINSLMSVANDLAANGSITPSAHGNLVKQLHAVGERQAAMQAMAKAGNVTAKEYHAVDGISFNNNSVGNEGKPSDETTNVMFDHHDEEATAKSAMADADRGIYPNPATLGNVKSHSQFMSIANHYIGAMQAKGAITANSSHAYIESEMQKLSSSPALSEQEQGKLNYYKNYLNTLKNKDYLEVQGATALGATINDQYVMKSTAIQNTVYGDEDAQGNSAKRGQALNENLNDYISKNKSMAYAQDMPVEDVYVIPKQISAPAQGSFGKDQDVRPAVDSMYALNKDNQYWLAKQMDKPIEKAALYQVGLIRNALPDGQTAPGFSYNLIQAAQSNRDISSLKVGDNGEKVSSIRYQIASNLRDELTHMAFVPEGNQRNGNEWQDGTVQLGINYVEDQAKIHGDFEMKNYAKYAQDYTDNVKRGFNLLSGANYSINANEMNITNPQAQELTYYMMDNLYKNIERRAGTNAALTYPDLLNVMVTNTRDGQLAIISADGTVIHSEPFTKKLMAAAQVGNAANRAEINKYIMDHTPATAVGQAPPYAPLEAQ